MFGQNPQRKIVVSDGSRLQVQAIFSTIQGEGPFSGVPAVFIRLAGCNLACRWCDTDFESSYEKGNEKSVTEITRVVLDAAPPTTRLVVLTGGEPLRQNVRPLVEDLLRYGYHVQFETAGVIAPQDPGFFTKAEAARRITFVVSPKTPKIAQWFRDLTNLHWKFVVGHDDAHPDDGLPWQTTQGDPEPHGCFIARPHYQWTPDGYPILDFPSKVWVSPRDDHDPMLNKLNMTAAATIAIQFGYRLSLQTHKIVGVE